MSATTATGPVFVPSESQLALNTKFSKDVFIKSLVDSHHECCLVLIQDYMAQHPTTTSSTTAPASASVVIDHHAFIVLPYYTIAHIVKTKDLSADDWIRMKKEDGAAKVDETKAATQAESSPAVATWGSYVPSAPSCCVM